MSAPSWHAIWAAYALSGAGVLPKLPLLQIALCAIAGVYLLRGVAGIPIAVVTVDYESVGVDVPADVARVEALIRAA